MADSNSTLSLLESLKLDFVLDENESSNDYIVIRTNYENGEDVQSFVEKIERVTNTNFRVRLNKKNLTKVLYRKKWICKHSAYKKKSSSKQNTGCQAFIDATIKKVTQSTKRSDPFLKLPRPLPCVIKLNLYHTHSIENADALRRLDVLPEVKKQFEEYFNSGYSVAEARRFHADKLISEHGHSILSNAAFCPTDNKVNYIHKRWRKKSYGLVDDPFTRLKDKLSEYEKAGAIVKFSDDEPWSVLVITPVMERAQQLLSSSEIIFLDSTSGCESAGSSFTVLVTATKSGGIPIGVLLHPYQTAENYATAFSLLQKTVKHCFGGQEAPSVFMTDDSAAEKNALSTIWPSARQLLCHFHVAQAEWRWLTSSSSDVGKADRQSVMKLFQAVMYATSEEDLEKHVQTILDLKEKYPKVVNRFTKFFERRQEWLLIDRFNLITRNNNTNNICEAAIRVLKDIILSRTRAYNIVALVDYIVNIFNNYLIQRLLKLAYNRCDNKQGLYEEFVDKIEPYKAEIIEKIDDDTYIVPSSDRDDIRYVVDGRIGYCTCVSGKMGGFCKHQFLLMQHLNLSMPNAPWTSALDRYSIAKVALGDSCQALDFFEDYINTPQKIITDKSDPGATSDPVMVSHPGMASQHGVASDLGMTSNPVLPPYEETPTEEEKQEFLTEVQRILPLMNSVQLKKLTANLKKISNPNILREKMFQINAIFSQKRKRKIRVQPTATSRRREGITRRTTPIPAGRPSKKRNHCLQDNMSQNVPNSKK